MFTQHPQAAMLYASFSVTTTRGNQVPVNSSASCHSSTQQYHGGRKRELWNQIDLFEIQLVFTTQQTTGSL